ncbi:MAG: glutamate 5-kinase [Propionibacteriaceae bacterium]|nr:glutamate 5-kinase [Propionibacteriaceae bacterium]
MITRQDIAWAGRLVVKVGSSSLSRDGHLDPAKLDALVDALAAHINSGHEVVLVSSGAQAAGSLPLGLSAGPRNLTEAQAAASVGQGLLIAHYTRAFIAHGLRVGQVLLTAEDVIRRSHYRNARRVLDGLLEAGIVPIINENDAVATDEIRFGDNDRLAALVSHIVRADALILLTDVDGLYTAPPGKPGSERIRDVATFDELEAVRVTGRGSKVGTGGMVTKVQAAAMASSSGIPALVTAATELRAALAGEDTGTLFQVTGKRVSARRMWLGYAAKMRGRLTVDVGAAKAITKGKKSLLPVGVVAVSGDFGVGEPVEIVDPQGVTVARGLSGFTSDELRKIVGLSEAEVAAKLGSERAVPAVHRDELVTQARARRPE